MEGAGIVCRHLWQKINDISVCSKCGATMTYDGKVLFDRKFIGYKPKKRKAKKK